MDVAAEYCSTVLKEPVLLANYHQEHVCTNKHLLPGLVILHITIQGLIGMVQQDLIFVAMDVTVVAV
jgi:hypothetical protein